ncbi:MAG: DNA polymerase IV [Vallitaleaceae bacterium]|nr:DNA polymerase IV [Vallitaleaceae bacterium]
MNQAFRQGPIIFHLDVNSAYLSWTAAHLLAQGNPIDLRNIPSVIGGDELSRHGIVLAKSIPAKRYGIQTGNPLRTALEQCPNLTIVAPDYSLYQKASRAMVAILKEYSPFVQQFSIDECFLDYSFMEPLFGNPYEAAFTIKERIHKELGFTINIGISSNKLLAKMASDFKKPDQIHTLFPDEIETKLWPLPVGDLFMVGRQTNKKLQQLGILTIGDLARTPLPILITHLKSFGILLHQYANGQDESTVRSTNYEVIKGIGNSTTIPFDVCSFDEAFLVLLSLCENVGIRLRNGNFCCSLISISIVTNEFVGASHQHKLDVATDSTNYIYEICKKLFCELWDHKPIRKLGVRVSHLQDHLYFQQSLFVNYNFQKQKQIDRCMDTLRSRYGKKTIQRASFLHSGLSPLSGGIAEEDYPVMTSIL